MERETKLGKPEKSSGTARDKDEKKNPKILHHHNSLPQGFQDQNLESVPENSEACTAFRESRRCLQEPCHTRSYSEIYCVPSHINICSEAGLCTTRVSRGERKRASPDTHPRTCLEHS